MGMRYIRILIYHYIKIRLKKQQPAAISMRPPMPSCHVQAAVLTCQPVQPAEKCRSYNKCAYSIYILSTVSRRRASRPAHLCLQLFICRPCRRYKFHHQASFMEEPVPNSNCVVSTISLSFTSASILPAAETRRQQMCRCLKRFCMTASRSTGLQQTGITAVRRRYSLFAFSFQVYISDSC